MGNDPCHCHCGELHVVVPSFRFPLTIVMQSFIFFGFLVAGEEIESKHSFKSLCRAVLTRWADPFGYDKNDLVRRIGLSIAYNFLLFLFEIEPGSLHFQDHSYVAILRILAGCLTISLCRKRTQGYYVHSSSRSLEMGLCT
jgi:hypothetical protein